MTPPLPPPGYELVEDEPAEGDMAWCRDGWERVDCYPEYGPSITIDIDGYHLVPARDLRWIARKKQ